ncbi:kinase-like protein [Aspergillus indologenus CBS 114.80]|uniref:Kinase-like protein n=1 Tax=Aspergillus indologenus CBS 114.80 TaxID=1450541 RepID=A0A2V5JBX3_9EURO|nr:kinase-like protein [Aspergillus indologenus CBS 114.80]
MEAPSQQNIIGAGQFSVVHKLSDKLVRKLPSDPSYVYSVQASEIEAKVYQRLGRHKRIARCICCADDHIDLRYEPNGNLESYLADHDPPVSAAGLRDRFARQAIEAVIYIHRMNVIHSDLSARQFLVSRSGNLRLSDFGGSSLDGAEAIVMENATHFLPRDEDSPNTVQSDLFALGSTIYEILVGRKPYDGVDDEEVQRLYSAQVFPPLESIGSDFWRNVILKCWRTEYNSASDIIADLPPCPFATRVFKKLPLCSSAFKMIRKAGMKRIGKCRQSIGELFKAVCSSLELVQRTIKRGSHPT